MEIFKTKFCSNNHLVIPLHPQVNYNIGQKSWDTFAFLGRFPIHTGPTLPLTPQTMLDACIQNFSRVSTLYRSGGGGGGGGTTARKLRKGCTVLRGNRQMTEKYEHCSTVPRTFVQDCGLSQNLLCTIYGPKQAKRGCCPKAS